MSSYLFLMKRITIFQSLIIALAISSVANAQFTVLHSFNDTAGSAPYGNLTIVKGVMYGTASAGGVNGDGCIFKIDTNGNGYKDLFDFNDSTATDPFNDITVADSNMYGITSTGGLNGYGCIFSLDTNGKGYKDLYDFTSQNYYPYPTPSLTLSRNVLYGVLTSGGARQYGSIFSISITGGNYKDIFDFNDTNGAWPMGSLLISGNKFYSMTSKGGRYNYGCIFSLDTNGTDYKDLYDFNDSIGAYPVGSLILSGNLLYGMTEGKWSVFSIDTNGNNFTVLHAYSGIAGGVSPSGSLTLAGNTLFGIANGGLNYEGCIFSLNTNGSGYQLVFNFNGVNGGTPPGAVGYPSASLSLSGNNLYGMWKDGGDFGDGVIFRINYITAGISELAVTNSISVYPNPSKGVFNFVANSDQLMANSSIEVYNVLGEKVIPSFAIHNLQFTINMGDQSAGVYLYRITDSNGIAIATGRLVMER